MDLMPSALANDLVPNPQDPNHNQLGLIAILVEEKLLKDIPLKDAITAYGERAQEKLPHSKAFIVEIPEDASAFQIASMLERLYLNGLDTSAIDGNPLNNLSSGKDDNHLVGVVLVGNLPLPVVSGENGTHPSLYPYTDFAEKAHTYNHAKGLFEINQDAGTPLPEVWHGVIRSNQTEEEAAKEELLAFFQKNAAYSAGDPQFSDVEKRLLYADFTALQEQMNWMDYKNYDRYTRYMEEMAFNRYNKNLLKQMIGEVSLELGSQEPIITDQAIDEMTDISTEQVFQKYLLPLAEALQVHLGKMNDALKELGRWGSQQIDTPASLITIRDAYAQGEILRQQLLLEKRIEDVVKATAEPKPVVIGATLKVNLEILGLLNVSQEFEFNALADGKMTATLQDINSCGMYRGQARQEGQTALENNSVYVQANQMYSLDSLVTPPPNNITDASAYKKAAGCVFNNSVDSSENNLSPAACLIHKARKPLFNLLGSKEVTENIPENLGWERCQTEDLNFHPNSGMFAAEVEQNMLLNEALFKERVTDQIPEEIFEEIGGTLDQLNPSVEQLIDKVYDTLVENNIAPPEEDLILKTNKVLTFLQKSGEEFSYAPHSKVDVTLSVDYQTKALPSVVLHNEPTAETLKTLYHIGKSRVDDEGKIDFPPLVTPSIPADGRRGLSFYKNGKNQHFEYPNLFRVEGGNEKNVVENLAKVISEKEQELSQLLGEPVGVMSDFVKDTPQLVEPIAWKNLSPDEKLKEILFKYTDEKEILPTPTGDLLSAPARKPKGYEVFYLRSNGNNNGFNLALANAMQAQDPQVKNGPQEEEQDLQAPLEPEADSEENNVPEEEGGKVMDLLPDPYVCGDPKGVEIWEWFAALQCWFQEEVIPDENFFSLNGDYSKSFEEVAAPTKEEGNAFRSEVLLDNILPQASSLKIEGLPSTLIVGQKVPFQISALNEQGQLVMGHLKDPIQLNLKNPALGDVNEKEFNLFTGEKTLMFEAKNPGQTQLIISMKGLKESTVPIHILPPLEIKWTSQEVIENGKSTFQLNLQLFDNKGNTVNDFGGEIILAPLHSGDGEFSEKGRVLFEKGKASTTFFPLPGKAKIELISRSTLVQSKPFILLPTSPAAHKLSLEPPKTWNVGEGLKLKLKATDEHGFGSFNYEEAVIATVKESGGKVLYQGLFNMKEGEATLSLPALKESGLLRLEFTSGTLKPLKITLPGSVTFTGQDLKDRFTQSLFVVFDGFAAGNILVKENLANAQLKNGLTQAVFAHMQEKLPPASFSVDPFYRVSLTQANQELRVSAGEGGIGLEVFDSQKMTPQLQFKMPLNLNSIVEADKEKVPESGTLAIDVLNESFELKIQDETASLLNENEEEVVRFEPKALFLPNADYGLVYEPNEAFSGLTLYVQYKEENIARLFFGLQAHSFTEEDFEFIDSGLELKPQWAGQSTQESIGAAFYDQAAIDSFSNQVSNPEVPAYLKSVASGVPVGEALRWDLPMDGILLGDPLLSFAPQTQFSLPYDYSAGEPIYQDSENNPIISLKNFNFNGDEFEDVALALGDGRIRLLEGGPTQPPFKDRGDLAFLADGLLDLEALDLEADGYEDLLLATQEGRLAILNNRKEWITRSDQTLAIGKKLYDLQVADMDSDGHEDLVTLDSRGDLKIFYYNNATQSFDATGMLVGNYGLNLKSGENLGGDLKIRYAGLQTPVPILDEIGGNIEGNLGEAWNQDNLSEEDKKAFFEAQENLAEAARNNPMATLTATQSNLLPWKENEEVETYFEKAQNLAFLQVNKTVENLTEANSKQIDINDELRYTLQISSNSPLNQVVLADVLPDALLLKEGSLKCLQGCNGAEMQQEGIYIFISGLNLSPAIPVVLSYEAQVKLTPQAAFNIKRLGEPEFLKDAFNDLVVSPAYNPTAYVVQHYSTGPRNYAKRSSSEDEPNVAPNEALDDFAKASNQLPEVEPGENSSSDDLPKIPGIEGALDEMTGANKCFESVETAEDAKNCVAQGLQKAAEKIAEFGCQGSGCFPTPWNYSFLVPPQMPFPVFAAPTTLITAAGPTPSAWPVSTFLGVANIKGTYNSKIRFYVSPTLTGGIGMAMCWGNYSGNSTPPTAKVPIPYPPPSGNCMVTALPIEKMPWGPVCKEIESQINQVMDAMNSGLSKVNGAITNLNNNPAIPASVNSTNSGAGGLEMSLGLNLGNLNRYDPPVQANSNIHLPSFDSITGVLSDWVDRQTLEISNKLLTLPTITLYLPEMKGFVARDTEKLETAATSWFNTMSKSASATKNTLSQLKLKDLSEDSQLSKEEKQEAKEENDQTRFQRYQAVENQMAVYNTNALQGLYDIASTLSILEVTQVPVEVNVPWISNAEITAYIGEMQQWLLHYEKELARVKDQWEKLSCPAQTTEEAIQQKMQEICARPGSNRCVDTNGTPNKEGLEGVRKEAQAQVGSICAASQIAQRFVVDFEEVKRSVEKNIEVLHSYQAFPKKLATYKKQIADYVESVAGFLDTLAQLTGGWLATIQQQLITWAEVILTIKEVVLNIKELFDIFINFDTQCSLCANERNSNFGWWSMLGLVLPDIPIIEFPKLPNIVIDLSQMEGKIDLEVPVLDINPKPIPLPPLPYFTLPEFPDINLVAKLPPLPTLPSLPNLPALPKLPPIPTFNLPTLPPPPKLPDVGKSLEVVSKIIQQILNIWCLVKKSLSPIPESMLNDQISLITARPAYLTPIDLLLKVEFPKIAPFDLGFNEVRFQHSMHYGIRLDAMPEVIERAADQWNEWMQALPNILNDQYAKSLALSEGYVQEILDYQKDTFGQAIDFVEAEFTKLQEESKFANKFAQAQTWSENQEAAWQEWVNTQEQKMNTKIDMTYDQYVTAVHKTNKLLGEKSDAWEKTIKDFMEKNNDIFQVMNLFLPLGGQLKALDFYHNNEKISGVLDAFNLQMAEALPKGPPAIYQLFQDIQACLNDAEKCPAPEQSVRAEPKINKQYAKEVEKTKTDHKNIDIAQTNSNISPKSDLKEQMQELLNNMQIAFNDMANAPLVDYKKVKEDFGVQDVKFYAKRTFLDDFKAIEQELKAYQDDLDQQANTLEKSDDLYAWLNSEFEAEEVNSAHSLVALGPKKSTEDESGLLQQKSNFLSPIAKADETPKVSLNTSQKNQSLFSLNLPTTTKTDLNSLNAVLSLTTPEALALEEENPVPEMGYSAVNACIAGLCLFDPNTSTSVPVVPVLKNNTSSQMAFLQKGDVVYSDGNRVYLKRDLSVEKSQINNNNGSVNVLNFDHPKLNPESPKKTFEAINNVKANFSENNQVQISWKAVNNPLLYGYGIQIERSPLGYDADQSQSPLPDITVVLLPKNEAGQFPKVEAEGQEVEPGTLVTLFDENQNAEALFGLKPSQTLNNIKKVRFPSLGNMEIELGPNKAVYVDTLSGNSARLALSNGFYQIKMLWFTDYGQVSTYSENKLLAPQSYGSLLDPIDVAKDTTIYLPVYQSKTLNASDFLIDLSGVAEYQWFMNGSNTAIVGDTLELPAQTQPGQFTIKLVAVQKQGNTTVSQMEKSFPIVVYSPKILLDQAALNKGAVSGSMEIMEGSEDDDLSKIPFSVLRQRNGLWKNLGSLVYKEGRITDMAFDEKTGAYLSSNAAGGYNIEGWNNQHPSSLLFKQTNGQTLAKVQAGTGQVKVIDPGFRRVALPAEKELPTRIELVHESKKEVAGYVYYRSQAKNPVELASTPLHSKNVTQAFGVLVADVNPNDTQLISFLPNDAPSLGGGVLLHDTQNKTPIMMVSQQGDAYLLDANYQFVLKPEVTEDESPIFQVLNQEGAAVMELFIPADFDSLKIEPPAVEKTGAVNQENSENSPSSISQKLPFNDVPETSPFYSAIERLFNQGLLQGYEDGSFRPGSFITRAEFVKVALGGTHCFDCSVPSDPILARYASTLPFPDISLQDWFFFCLAMGKELGMVKGYGDGLFRPNDNISRAEAVAILLREAKVPLINAPKGYFADVAESAWYKNEVYTAFTMGLIQEQAGFVKPDEDITRGEFAFMAENILNLVSCEEVDTDKDGLNDGFEMENNLDPFTPDENKNNRCECADHPYQDDKDEDGLIDVCDADLDNDGVENPICIFTPTGLVDENRVKNWKEKSGKVVDNCLFNNNADQGDGDGDGQGDACEESDLCPDLPEDVDGVEDTDGCPEVDDGLKEQEPGVYAEKGPLCQFIDYEADLMPGDKVMTAITDLQTHQIIYSQSEELMYQP